MKGLKKFITLSLYEKMLFMEALCFLFAAKILLLLLPFKYCLKFLPNLEHKNKPDIQELKRIKKAIYRTKRLAFWKNHCLVMSIASRWMLQRRRIPSRISLGVAFDENKNLVAHAWIRANGFDVIEKGGNYHELYQF
jgi:hypothetical protein